MGCAVPRYGGRCTPSVFSSRFMMDRCAAVFSQASEPRHQNLPAVANFSSCLICVGYLEQLCRPLIPSKSILYICVVCVRVCECVSVSV